MKANVIMKRISEKKNERRKKEVTWKKYKKTHARHYQNGENKT